MTINDRVQTFYIIGLYRNDEDETASLDFVSTTSLYIPITTAKKLNSAQNGYQSFTVVGKDGIEMNDLLNTTQSFFASFYTRNPSYTVSASSMESMVETMTSMLSTVTLAISAIAAISLLVGGIGVMNIMLVSITERTREIGTRKALGASESVIRFQFLVEAVIICLIGGILGIAAGLALGAAGAHLLETAARPSLMSCLIAVGFSMIIGIFFGYYPAGKAAKLDPIEALRYE